MSGAAQRAEGEVKTFFSGGPNTTGREVFEDSTATGPGAEFTEDNDTGTGEGYMSTDNAPVGAGTGVHHHGPHGGAGGVGSQAQDTNVNAEATGGLLPGQEGHHHHHHHGHHHHEGGVGGVSSTASELQSAERSQYGSGSTGAGEGSTGTGVGSTGASIGGTGQSGATTIDEATAGRTSEPAGVHHQGGAIGTTDKIGSMGENQALYERSGIDGPATAGAAGTDRFDTDKPSSGTTGSSVRSPEAGLEREETRERGAGKGLGGVMGVLGTSDKDFVARDRLGTGAYHDDQGRFKSNTDGPSGQTALTGREGNFNENPVSGEKNNKVGTTGTTGAAGADAPSQEAHKPGFIEKIKEML